MRPGHWEPILTTGICIGGQTNTDCGSEKSMSPETPTGSGRANYDLRGAAKERERNEGFAIGWRQTSGTSVSNLYQRMRKGFLDRAFSGVAINKQKGWE